MSQVPRQFRMTQWDVFSSKPLEGNSLAVFSDARGLTDSEMQAIAKEMNLSETTFILPRDPATEREAGIRVRIFTTQEELPFAGHPTLGTAFALRGDSGQSQIVLALNVGKVPVRFEEKAGQPTFGEMTRKVEAHLIGFRGDLYGKTVELDFVEWLRGTQKFLGLAELLRQIQADIEETKRIVSLYGLVAD